MSVRSSERSESKTEYIEAARRLAVEVSKIMADGPKKYGASHGDHIVKSALSIYGRERKRIAANAEAVASGLMPQESADASWQSWEAYASRYDAHRTLATMRDLVV